MGLLDGVGRWLDRLKGREFARVFRAELGPAEIAVALRRECDDTTVARGRERPVAANDYVVQLAPADHARLAVRSGALCPQLQDAVRAHAFERRYLLAGSPAVRLEIADDLPVGLCRVLGLAVQDVAASGARLGRGRLPSQHAAHGPNDHRPWP